MLRMLARRVRRILLAVAALMSLFTCVVVAQAGLVVADVQVVSRPDIFGVQTLFADGVLMNNTESAYGDIVLYAEVYNGDELVGEGFGYPVNACGTGLLDFALQPGEQQTFSVTLELYEPGADYERVEIVPEASETQADPAAASAPAELADGIVAVTDREVVSVEWIDSATLRYGVGCDADLFSSWDWFQYSSDNRVSFPVEHPRAEFITPAMLQQVGLIDPALLRRSYLSFHPSDTRMIYQTDINTLITAERDGSFKRILYDNLARVSLHGFGWLPEGRFIAYYYGAFGEPVRYFTGSMLGQRISASVYEVVPSQTLPGATPDGGRVVIGTTIADVTGYFFTFTGNGLSELLFEVAPEMLPGNNYPAPLVIPQSGEEGGGFRILLVRPVDDDPAVLQCFNTATGDLSTGVALPLNLTPDDRAHTSLSPDGATLALAANGEGGGLWLVDVRGAGC